MNETAARLRAQKAHSTDPDYLERMAVAEEAREARTAGTESERKDAPAYDPGHRPIRHAGKA